MAEDTIITANDNTGADGGEVKAPEQTGADTLLGGDPTQEQKAEGQEEQKPVGAPEAYADFNLPEGIEIDKGMLDGVKAQFKAAGYTQEQAQAAIASINRSASGLEGPLGDFGTQTVPQLYDTILQLDQATRSLQSLIDNVRNSPREFISKAPSKEIEVQP